MIRKLVWQALGNCCQICPCSVLTTQFMAISFCLSLYKLLFFELAHCLLRSLVSIEIGWDCVLFENSKTILTPITEFVETANSCRTELKSNLSTQFNLIMSLCIRLHIFFVLIKNSVFKTKQLRSLIQILVCTKVQLSRQIRLERRWTDTCIEPLHNLLSGISCSFVDTIGLSRVNLCIKKGGSLKKNKVYFFITLSFNTKGKGANIQQSALQAFCNKKSVGEHKCIYYLTTTSFFKCDEVASCTSNGLKLLPFLSQNLEKNINFLHTYLIDNQLTLKYK